MAGTVPLTHAKKARLQNFKRSSDFDAEYEERKHRGSQRSPGQGSKLKDQGSN
jgi:hypothetical protein